MAKPTLFGNLKDIEALPEGLDKDGLKRDVIELARKDSPVLDEVLDHKTSVTQLVSPIIEANLRLGLTDVWAGSQNTFNNSHDVSQASAQTCHLLSFLGVGVNPITHRTYIDITKPAGLAWNAVVYIGGMVAVPGLLLWLGYLIFDWENAWSLPGVVVTIAILALSFFIAMCFVEYLDFEIRKKVTEDVLKRAKYIDEQIEYLYAPKVAG